jgi:hypothetical protein
MIALAQYSLLVDLLAKGGGATRGGHRGGCVRTAGLAEELVDVGVTRLLESTRLLYRALSALLILRARRARCDMSIDHGRLQRVFRRAAGPLRQVRQCRRGCRCRLLIRRKMITTDSA